MPENIFPRYTSMISKEHARNNFPVLHLSFSPSLPKAPGFGTRSSQSQNLDVRI